MPDLHRRLNALTPFQRALLARRLDVEYAPRTPSPSPAQLVAYVVPDPDFAPSSSDVHAYLKARVPDFMVPSAVVVLKDLPRLPNGKVDLRALPTPDSFEAAALTPPRNAVEEQLATIWAEVLGAEVVGVHDNFFEIGGDSILSIQIISRANQAGLRIKPSQFFEHPTIAALASAAAPMVPPTDEGPPAPGPVPLSPIQLWFFEQPLSDPGHWNQGVVLDVARASDVERLERAILAAVGRHDAFRLRFKRGKEGWAQALAPVDSAHVSVAHHDLSASPPSLHEPAIERIWAESQHALDLAQGPLLHAALVDRGPAAPYRAIFTGHHLAVDVVSWQTLLEDVETAYEGLGTEAAPEPVPTGTPFSRWATALQGYARSAALQAERGYWLDQAALTPLPTEGAGANIQRSARTLTLALDQAETRALSDASAAYGMRVHELVLTALAGILAAWSDTPRLRFDLEGHGRIDLADALNGPDALDVSRTVGWFTTLYPVLLEPGPLDDPRRALTNVKEQLRRVPHQGIGYGLLRYASDDSERHRRDPAADVLFNYAGHAHPRLSARSPLRAPVTIRGSRDPDGVRAHLIEVDAFVADGTLTLRWTYCPAIHWPETIGRLARDTRAAVRALTAHCLTPGAGGYTPSDFPDVDLSQGDLDALLGDLA